MRLKIFKDMYGRIFVYPTGGASNLIMISHSMLLFFFFFFPSMQIQRDQISCTAINQVISL